MFGGWLKPGGGPDQDSDARRYLFEPQSATSRSNIPLRYRPRPRRPPCPRPPLQRNSATSRMLSSSSAHGRSQTKVRFFRQFSQLVGLINHTIFLFDHDHDHDHLPIQNNHSRRYLHCHQNQSTCHSLRVWRPLHPHRPTVLQDSTNGS